jgi:hypothetical protein
MYKTLLSSVKIHFFSFDNASFDHIVSFTTGVGFVFDTHESVNVPAYYRKRVPYLIHVNILTL